MFRLYSKGCEYAIRALMQLTAAERGGTFTAKAVCCRAGIPEPFTRKIFQALVQGGFLAAVPGRRGGYRLKRAPERLSARCLIEAVDGAQTFGSCVMGLPVCSDRGPCPMHATWRSAKQHLLAALETITLQDLMDLAAAPAAGPRTHGHLSG
jgi:Rrf2 family protein